MGNTYYCNYYNSFTGQTNSFECPCDLCWNEWNPNTENPCPPCPYSQSKGLIWYYWVLISIGILILLFIIASIFVCRRKKRQRQMLLLELENSQRKIQTNLMQQQKQQQNAQQNRAQVRKNVTPTTQNNMKPKQTQTNVQPQL